MLRDELMVQLERLAAEAALCRANLREIGGALEACRRRLGAAVESVGAVDEEPAAAAGAPGSSPLGGGP